MTQEIDIEKYHQLALQIQKGASQGIGKSQEEAT